MYLDRRRFNHTYRMPNEYTWHPVHQTAVYTVTEAV